MSKDSKDAGERERRRRRSIASMVRDEGRFVGVLAPMVRYSKNAFFVCVVIVGDAMLLIVLCSLLIFKYVFVFN